MPVTAASTHSGVARPLPAELAELAGLRQYPSVSLLVSLSSERGPWLGRLDGLRRTAERRLEDEFGRHADPGLLAALRRVTRAPQPAAGGRGMAVFLSADTVRVLTLPVEVRDRVVIDETFATRDLVHAVNRTTSYVLLALDPRRPRLLRGTGPLLTPLPLDVPAMEGERSGDRARTDRRRRSADRRNWYREVDRSLAEALGDGGEPLVVVGVEPTLSQFAGASRHHDRVEGMIRRAPDGSLDDLAAAVAPSLEEIVERRCAAALDAVGRGVPAGRAVWGLHDVWRQVHLGGGGTLVVEAGFEQPAVPGADGALGPVSHRDDPGVTDDAVDELIEQVLARRGRVQVVPDGALETYGRVVLLTWEQVGSAAALPDRPVDAG